MTSLTQNMVSRAERALGALEALQPLAQPAARLYVAKVFLLSGLTKLRDFWGSLLIGLVLWGPGRWSVDAWWLARRAHEAA